MATHAGSEYVTDGQIPHPGAASGLHLVGEDAASAPELRPSPAPSAVSMSRKRRVLTREQGQALETLSHAIDYLSDCHWMLGSDSDDVLTLTPATDAIRLLMLKRYELLHSFPLAEPLMARLWNAIFHRHSHRVVGLSLR